jgi:hypothetical protein
LNSDSDNVTRSPIPIAKLEKDTTKGEREIPYKRIENKRKVWLMTMNIIVLMEKKCGREGGKCGESIDGMKGVTKN